MNKSHIKNHQLNKQTNKVSPHKNSTVQRIQQKYENPILQKIKQEFSRDIEGVIKKINEFQMSNTASRCISHNNIITLYCQIDRQPLCANCMYECQTHRTHRVVPVERADNMIKEDIIGFYNKLTRVTEQLHFQENEIKKRKIDIEKYYDNSVQKLKKFYKEFRELIQNKQKTQLIELQDIRCRVNKQNTIIFKQIQNITQSIKQNLNKFSHHTYNQQIITKRTALQALSRSKKIIKYIQKLNLSNKQIPKVDFQKYQLMLITAQSKLNLTVPLLIKNNNTSRTGLNFQSKGLSQNYSSPKLSLSRNSSTGNKKIRKNTISKTPNHKQNASKKVEFRF